MCKRKSIHLCYFNRRVSSLSIEVDCSRNFNNFLIKDVQMKNQIVWKCANENLLSGVLSNENFLNLRWNCTFRDLTLPF